MAFLTSRVSVLQLFKVWITSTSLSVCVSVCVCPVVTLLSRPHVHK